MKRGFIGAVRRDLDVCESTNDEAARWAREGADEGALVVARRQTRGRGRQGHVWDSTGDESLYCSIVLRPAVDPMRVPPLTLAVGVALAETLRGFGIAVELKWPNDVLVDGKKCAGILCEMSGAGGRVSHVIVGIGVNLKREHFPEELRAIATSLPLGRDEVLESLCRALELWYARFVEEGVAAIVKQWTSYARLLGREVTVKNGNELVMGTAEALDDDGTLIVRTVAGGAVRVVAGELTFQ